MKRLSLIEKVLTNRLASLLLMSLAFICLGTTVVTSEVQAQIVRFDIKKGSSVEGDVSLTSGALKINSGPYTMRIDGGIVDLKKPSNGGFQGFIKNNAAKRNGDFKEINFDGKYTAGQSYVTKYSNRTVITFRNLPCHESFDAYFATGYKALADVELVIYNTGAGTFTVNVTQITGAFEGVNSYWPPPARFPKAKTGSIASGKTLPGTIMKIS